MQRAPSTNKLWRRRSKVVWALLLRVIGLLPCARWWVGRSGVLVLTFHRVLTDNELESTASQAGMIVRATTFDQFLAYASEHWKIVDVAQTPEWTRDSRLKVAITFDDGWYDNVTSAYPITRKHNVPLTIFIVPEKMGTALPFWPEQAALSLAGAKRSANGNLVDQVIEELKALPAPERQRRIEQMQPPNEAARAASAEVDRTMTWEQTAQLQASGVHFGSHSSTHEILTHIPAEEAEREITASRSVIGRRLSTDCALFAYPNGDCSPPVRDLVVKAGYSTAFLNDHPGVWDRDCDPYLVPRINVCEHHFMDSKGRFSPMVFEYTVVWRAAEGILTSRCAQWFRRMAGKQGSATHPRASNGTDSSAK